MGQIVSQLEHLLAQSIPTIVIVIFLLVFLDRLFFRPLSQTLEAREKATSGALAEARREADRAEEKLGQYEREIQSARQAIYRERDEARRQALSEREKRIQEARSRAESMVNDAQADLDRQTAAAKIELRTAVESLATEATVSLFAPHLSGRSGQGGAQA